MIVHGHVYSYTEDRWGNIRVAHGERSVYLQGDDTNDLRDSLAAMELIRYPNGPFQTFEQHLDAVLDQYEPLIQAEVTQ